MVIQRKTETKTIQEVKVGEVFKIDNHLIMKTNQIYNNDNVYCIDLETGNYTIYNITKIVDIVTLEVKEL